VEGAAGRQRSAEWRPSIHSPMARRSVASSASARCARLTYVQHQRGSSSETDRIGWYCACLTYVQHKRTSESDTDRIGWISILRNNGYTY